MKATITIPVYEHNHGLIKDIQTLISSRFSNLFHAVIVHGSVATNEIVAYSDFDGVLIVKDNYKASKELACFIQLSANLIYKFDPLQHHNWFVISESQLLNYPENELPSIVFKQSRLIYPKAPITLSIESNNINYRLSLEKILAQFEKRKAANWKPGNIFQVKGYLSQIMLLPSLYFAAVNNTAIGKKESFVKSKEYFSGEEWLVISLASDIRLNWQYHLNPAQKKLLSISNPKIRRFTRKFFAPKPDPQIENIISSHQFNTSLQLMLTKMKAGLKH